MVINAFFSYSQGHVFIAQYNGLELTMDVDYYNTVYDVCTFTPGDQYKITVYFANNSGRNVVPLSVKTSTLVVIGGGDCPNAQLFRYINLDFPLNSGDITSAIDYFYIKSGSQPSMIIATEYHYAAYQFEDNSNNSNRSSNNNSNNQNGINNSNGNYKQISYGSDVVEPNNNNQQQQTSTNQNSQQNDVEYQKEQERLRQQQLLIQEQQQFAENQRLQEQKRQQQLADQQKENEQKQEQRNIELQKQQELENAQRQEQYKERMQALEKLKDDNDKRVDDLQNETSQSIDNIITMLQERSKQQDAQLERQIEEKRIQEQIESMKQEQQNEERKQMEEATKKKISSESANLELWKTESAKIIPYQLTEYTRIKRTNQILDQTLQSIYYIIWNFSFNKNQIILSNPIEIKKSDDGDWPTFTDMTNKIEAETNLAVNQTPDRISAPENALGFLLGYFTDAITAAKAEEEIKLNALQNGYSVRIIDSLSEKDKSTDTKQKESNDFWKE